MQSKTTKPHKLGTRIVSKTFKADLAGNTPVEAAIFSMTIKQTFKTTKVLMFERVGRSFYAEFKISV